MVAWQILVDYGGSYFEKDSSEDSDMHDSDDEFDVGKVSSAKKRKLPGGRAAAAAKPPAGKKRKKSD